MSKPTIKLLVLDVDGILTDGQLIYNALGEEVKAFHAHDGLGLKHLADAGIEVAIISGRQSPALEVRLKELNIKHHYLGIKDKLPVLQKLLSDLSIQPNEVAYMGDDLPDQACMEYVGTPISVPNAHQSAQSVAGWITNKCGGYGAVREVCDWILNKHVQ